MLSHPSSDLEECIDRCKRVHDQVGTKQIGREALVAALGYRSLSGASIAKISDLRKFGLITGNRDDIRVSDIFMKIRFPQPGEDVQSAKLQAATMPGLFADLHSKFPQFPISEANISSYLARSGLDENRAQSVTRDYLRTMEYVNSGDNAHSSTGASQSEPQPEVRADANTDDKLSFTAKGVSVTVTKDADKNALILAREVIEVALAEPPHSVPQLTYETNDAS